MPSNKTGTFPNVGDSLTLVHISALTLTLLLFVFALSVRGEEQRNPLPEPSNYPAIGTAGVESRAESPAGGLGARIYNDKCAGCHGTNGQGSPNLFPPLAGDPVVTATDPYDHIRTVLFGRHGTIIGGVTYTVYMPSWAGQLSDREIAAVINHERTSWGNKAPTITPAEVAKVRGERR